MLLVNYALVFIQVTYITYLEEAEEDFKIETLQKAFYFFKGPSHV